MGSKRASCRRRSLLQRLKRFVLLRPWVLNVAFAIVRIILDRELK